MVPQGGGRRGLAEGRPDFRAPVGGLAFTSVAGRQLREGDGTKSPGAGDLGPRAWGLQTRGRSRPNVRRLGASDEPALPIARRGPANKDGSTFVRCLCRPGWGGLSLGSRV